MFTPLSISILIVLVFGYLLMDVTIRAGFKEIYTLGILVVYLLVVMGITASFGAIALPLIAMGLGFISMAAVIITF